jgi:protein SCO1/2
MLKAALLVALCVFGSAAHAQPPVGTPGGRFELIGQDGKAFSSATLAGTPYAVFFGFTNCPDICPTTLLMMSNALARLGADADRLRVLFVTVDPEQDTPAQLAKYMASFDPRITALTGSAEQIAATAKLWKAFYHKLPEDKGGYTIVHSAYVYLMDRDNRLAGTLNFQEGEVVQVEKLRKLLQ